MLDRRWLECMEAQYVHCEPYAKVINRTPDHSTKDYLLSVHDF